MQNMKSKPRSKSSSNLDKLQKKEIKKSKNTKKNHNKTPTTSTGTGTGTGCGAKKSKAVSMKKRKSAISVTPKSGSTSKKKKNGKTNDTKSLKPKQPKFTKRKTLTLLPTPSNKKKKALKNSILNNRDYDRYSFGECIVDINNDNFFNWPWLNKYKLDIGKNYEINKKDNFLQCLKDIKCSSDVVV